MPRSMKWPAVNDVSVAYREGWSLFLCDDGKLRIQRLDFPADACMDNPDDPIFASDDEALEHVTRRALAGSEVHKLALTLHETEGI